MKNKTIFISGFLAGIALCLVVFFATTQLQKNDSATSKASNTVETTEETLDIADKKENKKQASEGTLSNPLPLGKEGTFTYSDFSTETTFEVKFKIEDFQDANNLANFEPSFYNNLTLKKNYTYYGVKINIAVLDGSDENSTYYFDVLNSMKIFIDGAESSDDVIDMNLTDYSGIDGNLAIGATKTGWAGFQAPTNAKTIVAQIGGYGSDFYVNLK